MFTIDPIRCGTLHLPKAVSAYLQSGDQEVAVPVYSFLITGRRNDTAILVDTGVKEPDADGLVRGRRVDGAGFDPLEAGLAERGLGPRDIDFVVLSHLHHDHAAHTERFTEAEAILQRAEWEAANDPLPPVSRAYDTDMIRALDAVDVRLVDGDAELVNGVDLLHTPGHTEGMQSVFVRTEDGLRAITADLAYTKFNLNPTVSEITDVRGKTVKMDPTNCAYWPPGIFVNMEQCYESMERIWDQVPTDAIFFSHDPRLVS